MQNLRLNKEGTCMQRQGSNTSLLNPATAFLPGIVAPLWIVADVIEHAPEVHKDAAGRVWGDEARAHLLGGSVGGHDNGALLEAHVVVLTKGLHQRGPLQD